MTAGLIEMGARPYDPQLGRFYSTDGGSANNYDYTCQDPINGYDLRGLSCGPGKRGDQLTPDFGLTSACAFHDDCYGGRGTYYNKTRSQCDSDFRERAGVTCSRNYGKTILGIHVDPRFRACQAYKETLYAGVIGPGHFYDGYYQGHYGAWISRGGTAKSCKKSAANMSRN